MHTVELGKQMGNVPSSTKFDRGDLAAVDALTKRFE